MIQPAFEILNQRGTPMFFSDVFANRPTAGIVGRIFISTDTYAFYRDTGSGWDLIGGPGTGTITGSGTIGTLPIWNGTQVIGDSSLLEGSTKFTTTKDFQADGYYLSGMTSGSGALYWTSDRVTLANYNATGNVMIEVGGGQFAQLLSGTDLSSTFYGNIIRNGGLSTQFLKADGSLDSNTYNTGSGSASQVAFWSATNALSGENNLWWDSTNNYLGINTNTPSVPLDVHHSGNNGFILNQTTGTNNNLIAFQTSGNGRWRIGNFYNAGADDYGIFDVVGNIQPFTIAKTTGQTFIGSKITASGRLVINSASSDAHIQVVGANAPSIRIDNAGTGATQRLVFGLATATNNFIQGSTAGDICISTASASPLLFGMWQTINASEVMRLSTLNNLLLGSVVDNGIKFQVTGGGYFSSNLLVGTSTDNGRRLRISQSSGDYVAQISQLNNTLASHGLTIDCNTSSNVNIGLEIYSASAGVFKTRLFTDGSATFSSTITASTINGGTSAIFQNTNVQNSNGIELRGGTAGTAVNWKIEKDNTLSNALQITPSTTAGGTTYTTPLLSISSTNLVVNSSSIDLNPSSGSPNITLRSGGTFRGYIEGNASGGMSFGAGPSATIVQTITSAGNIGVNLTTPLSKFHVNGTLQVGFVDVLNNAMTLSWNGASSYGSIQTASSSSLALNPSGNNVLVGTTLDNGKKLRVVGDIEGTIDLYLARTSVSPAIVLSQSRLRIVDSITGYSSSIDVYNDGFQFGGSIKTSAPSGGTANLWKLGSRVAASVSLNTTQYIEIDIAGTLYKLATVT